MKPKLVLDESQERRLPRPQRPALGFAISVTMLVDVRPLRDTAPPLGFEWVPDGSHGAVEFLDKRRSLHLRRSGERRLQATLGDW